VLSAVAAAALVVVASAAPGRVDADIYRWVDASGRMTFSDQAPPKGVRVAEVIHVAPAATSADDPQAGSREATRQLELKVLQQRVRILELEMQRSSSVPPPPSPVTLIAPPPATDCESGLDDCGPNAVVGAYPYVSTFAPGVALPRYDRGHGFRRHGAAPHPRGGGSVAFVK